GRQGAEGRPHLPALAADRRRYPGLVQDPSARAPGKAAVRPHAGTRDGAAGAMEGQGLMANLYDLLAGGFPADRSRPAFLLSDGAAVSYGQLEEGAAQVAGHLVASGVQPGDRVGLQVEKSVEAVMIYLGVLKAGGVFLPLNAAYTPAEVGYFPRDDADLASLIYTSGTTGRSKGAMLSHGALAANALALHEIWGFTPDDVLLHALPIFHVHGLFVALHCAFLSGAPMVWLPKFDDAQVLAGLVQSTVMMGVPTFYTRLLANAQFTRE